MIRLTRAQVREIDRRAVEDYGIPGIVLMENAARAIVDVATEMLRGIDTPEVAIVCGGGNNGGDGLACARHLCNRYPNTEIVLATDPQKYRGDAAINWRIAQATRMYPRHEPLRLNRWHLIIDALFGTGLDSSPRDSQFIDMINACGAPVLAVDLPSGMDCDTGQPFGACVRATRTVTFVAEKAGFANPASKQFTGEITVGDIGCPRELIEEVARMSPA